MKTDTFDSIAEALNAAAASTKQAEFQLLAARRAVIMTGGQPEDALELAVRRAGSAVQEIQLAIAAFVGVERA